MANKLQKFLFNLSTMSPLIIILALVYWIEENIPFFVHKESEPLQIDFRSICLSLIIIFALLFSFYSLLVVKICRKKFERIPISIDSISSNDGWVVAVIIAYALPTASFVFKENNLFISGILIMLLLITLACSNVVYPNPLLMLSKYHFYKIINVDGGGEISLLSKRASIVNRDSVTEVICAFDYLAIEEINS